jgi:hypothetical protein
MNAPLIGRILRSYQQRAATFLYERDAAFLIAPLGAGKCAWSAELTEQAIARIYRPGQTQHVTIHVCVDSHAMVPRIPGHDELRGLESPASDCRALARRQRRAGWRAGPRRTRRR